MTEIRADSRTLRRTSATVLLLGLALLYPGCDRALVEPALASGDDAALLRAAGVGGLEGRHTLGSLVLEAADVVRQSRGDAAAGELLEPLLQRQAVVAEIERAGADWQAVGARQAVREAELAIALDVLGAERVEQVVTGATADLAKAAAALDSAAVRNFDLTALRQQQIDVEQGLAAARLALADSALSAALDAGTRAAEQLGVLRRGIVDLYRVAGLRELYGRAERTLTQANGEIPEGAELLLNHARLQEAARLAVAEGNRVAAHAALAAVREDELRLTLHVLGPGCAAEVVAGVDSALSELRSSARGSEARLRRMFAAATDLHLRASRALATGDAVAALDLGSYAAGLVNSYRLALSRL